MVKSPDVRKLVESASALCKAAPERIAYRGGPMDGVPNWSSMGRHVFAGRVRVLEACGEGSEELAAYVAACNPELICGLALEWERLRVSQDGDKPRKPCGYWFAGAAFGLALGLGIGMLARAFSGL